MAEVFISYSRADLDAVNVLVQDLEGLGYEPWFDQALTGGQRWWDNILSQIRNCEFFVSTLTPESL
ncbi:MAG: toll/interleukin-1 receptor domain-containing protein, partial [Xanthobacteraceae bacterium]